MKKVKLLLPQAWKPAAPVKEPKVAIHAVPSGKDPYIVSICAHCGYKGTTFGEFATEASMRQVLQENAFPWKCPSCETLALSALDMFKHVPTPKEKKRA